MSILFNRKRQFSLKVRVRLLFAWYDFWIGVFIDRNKRTVYFLPVPCAGLVISWEKRQ